MIDINKIDFKKGHGLVPVIAQDIDTQKVLMMGYANEEAIQVSQKSGKLTFFSRSKNRLWTKGEESGNFLEIISMALDCDVDTILAKVRPKGPVCHTGTDTCWAEANPPSEIHFIEKLESVIEDRKKRFNAENSYVASLFAKGINKIAQKVGEEAVEMVIESKDDNEALFLGEAADLLFHYLILLQAKGYKIDDVLKVLQERHK
ncbi:MAG: bifunctional phosphoribosyl-AMP cyclohydrolase/phosphoribosyl-ATP diphosphatase HisIE [Saprospiraceae bacterium]|nr:bifunctional phosphoribosyl-AMP cyclohydrolase/phosphoribosyl-ATP diphosphatase HisIE [Saprospiraceae bacterium]